MTDLSQITLDELYKDLLDTEVDIMLCELLPRSQPICDITAGERLDANIRIKAVIKGELKRRRSGTKAES
jgi:hypothetical protein